ncbi:MAG: TRAP transporter small permease [Candidatus Adiutrix sp.]
MIRFLKKCINFYDFMEARILVASLVVTVGLIFMQIVMRAVFNSSLSWSEELARYIFIWQTWLGVSVGLKENKHITVEVLFKHIRGKKAQIIKIISSLLCVFLCVFLAWFGWKVMRNAYIKSTVSSAMLAPLWVVYLALPVSCVIASLRHLGRLGEQFKQFYASIAPENLMSEAGGPPNSSVTPENLMREAGGPSNSPMAHENSPLEEGGPKWKP